MGFKGFGVKGAKLIAELNYIIVKRSFRAGLRISPDISGFNQRTRFLQDSGLALNVLDLP